MRPKRGEIWYADLGEKEGSEQRGVRPVLIIQNNAGNKHSPTVIVASITDSRKKPLPTHVYFDPIGRLKKRSVIMLEQIRTIDKSKLDSRVAVLPVGLMAVVAHKIKISLGLIDFKDWNQADHESEVNESGERNPTPT